LSRTLPIIRDSAMLSTDAHVHFVFNLLKCQMPGIKGFTQSVTLTFLFAQSERGQRRCLKMINLGRSINRAV